MEGTFYFSKYLTCNNNTGKCNYIGQSNTKVVFDIDENGGGTIMFYGLPENIGCEIDYNNIEYSDIGRSITFYTTRGNRVKWFINSKNESESISIIHSNNMSISYTNR